MTLYIIALIIIIILIILYNVYEKFENIIILKKDENNKIMYEYITYKLPFRFPFTFNTTYPTSRNRTYGSYLSNHL